MNYTPDYKGIGQTTNLTFIHSGLIEADEGKPVKISANKTVALSGDGEPIHGILIKVETNHCTVSMDGIHKLVYTGANPTVGTSKYLANATGGIKTDVAGKELVTLDVDTTNKIATVLLW